LIRPADRTANYEASACQQIVPAISAAIEIFRRGCIQSLRCGVMLAERKKWKLANNVLAVLLGEAVEKF